MVRCEGCAERMSMEAGTTTALRVAREVSPNGFFLTDGHQDVLLPYSEARGKVQVGETVEAFLFHDSSGRLAATMRTSLIQLHEIRLLEVVDLHPTLGCFLEIGIGRNLLLPIRELPENRSYWPQPEDSVYVRLEHDKSGRMLGIAAKENDLEELVFHAPTAWMNRWMDCRVYKPLKMGTFVIVEGGDLGLGAFGFIHEEERTRALRMGERVQARVSFVREDGRVNLSMKPRKEVSRVEDSVQLLQVLAERPNGAMPYSDETPADIIQRKFNMSKAAFKRALGKLMKEGTVYQEGSWTCLTKPSAAEETESDIPQQTAEQKAEMGNRSVSETLHSGGNEDKR